MRKYVESFVGMRESVRKQKTSTENETKVGNNSNIGEQYLPNTKKKWKSTEKQYVW